MRFPAKTCDYRLLFVIALANTVCISEASAQVIDGYFSPEVAGIGGLGGDSVRSHPRSDYDPLGIRVGSFILGPKLVEGIGFDSNVAAVKNGPGSAIIDTAASLSAGSNWSRNSLDASFSLDDKRYLTRRRENQTNWTASVAGSIDLGEDKLSTAYTHLNLHETPGDIAALLSDRPIPFRVDDARVGYSINTGGKFSLTPYADVTTYRYDNIGGAADATYRNRNVYEAGLTAGYELSPRRDLVLVLRGTHIGYSKTLQATPNLNSNGGAVLAGIDYSAAGVFRYRALIGYQTRHYTNPQLSSLSAPIIEASVTWTPTRLTTITATARRDIQDAAAEGATGFTYTAAALSIDHEYLRNVLLNGHAEVQRADQQSGTRLPGFVSQSITGGSQTIYGFGVGTTWLMNRNMRLSVAYDLTTRQASAGASYTKNVVLLSLTFQL